MFGVAIVPSILLALGMAFSPESPRWLFQVFFARLKKSHELECFYGVFNFHFCSLFYPFYLSYWFIYKDSEPTTLFCSKGRFLKLKNQ